MIRTGNPQFAGNRQSLLLYCSFLQYSTVHQTKPIYLVDIFVANSTAVYNATCLRQVLRLAGAEVDGSGDSFLAPTLVKTCVSGHERGDVEEEIS